MPSAGIAGFVGAGVSGAAGAAAVVADGVGAAVAVGAPGGVGLLWVLILRWAFLLVLPMFILHLCGVWTTTDRALDRYFPLLVMGTFLLALLY
jgi:hypothetical protein